jgi:NADH-quinone oxidoreductase subunit H
MNFLAAVVRSAWFTPVVLSVVIVLLGPLVIGYISLLERKVLADFQVRYGPMRVGPRGLLQPLADGLKFILKEDIVPANAEKYLFLLAPIFSVFAALLGFTMLPFSEHLFVSDVNIGLLIIASVSALGILGIIVGGWASNSHYPLLGALRSAAQLISYEVALGLGLLAGAMVSGTLSLRSIVETQQARHLWFLFSNYGAMIVPFAVYFIASVAETNRSPFDLPEAESELVAGYHTEFSGFRFALYMLAEWANILVVSSVAVTLFLGGWLRPFPSASWLEIPLNVVFPLALFGGIGLYCFKLSRGSYFRHDAVILVGIGTLFALAGLAFLVPPLQSPLSGLFWFFFKLSAFVYVVIWLRATLPRVRYDQLMSFGWKWLIPLGLAGVGLNAVLGML